MTLGIVRTDQIFHGRARRARATRSSTSARRRAATASTARRWPRRSSATRRTQKRPTVQVGDPFTEKLLLEACLELFETDAVVGIQDMGAAGPDLLDVRDGRPRRRGVEIDLSKVPRARDRHDALRDHAVGVAGADAPRRAARPPRRRSSRSSTSGSSTPSRSARHGLGPRRALLRRQDRRGPSGRAALGPRARLRPARAPPRRRPPGRSSGRPRTSRPTSATCLRRILASPERRREVLDLDAVRPHGAVEHGPAPGRRRRRRSASRARRRASR